MRVRATANARQLFHKATTAKSWAYQYKPLPDQDSLRLLEIKPAPAAAAAGGSSSSSSTTTTSSPVEVSIQTFKIKDAPPFDALSYTWGFPFPAGSSYGASKSFRQLAFFRQAALKYANSHSPPDASGPHHVHGDVHGDAVSIATSSRQNRQQDEKEGREDQQCRPQLPTDLTACFPVHCQGQRLHVTANLHDALQMLSRSESVGLERSRYIWIDSICIQQSDIAERNTQVAVMGKIFRRAKKVITWVGEEDEFVADALEVIEQVSAIPEPHWPSVPYTGFFDAENFYYKAGVKPLTYHNWLGFLHFINRPYFRRAWIVQELALAESADLVCGKKVLRWEALSKTLEFIKTTRWYHHLFTDKMKHIAEIQQDPGPYAKFLESKSRIDMAPFYLVRTQKELEGRKFYLRRPTLRLLLDRHRNTDASDPRDKVYAFLGLVNSKMDPTSRGGAIDSDYNTTVQRVFSQTAKAFMLSRRSLSLLSHVQDPSITKVENLPSWVPDYTVKLSPYPLQFRGQCNWSASGFMNWSPNPEMMDKGLLPAEGYLVDKVSETALMIQETSDPGESWASIVRIASQLDDEYPFYSKNGQPLSRVEVLWRTLTTDTYERKHPAPSSCGELFIDYILNLQIRHRLAPWSSTIDFHPHQKPTTGLVGPDWEELFAAEPEGSRYGLKLYRKRFVEVLQALFKGTYSPLGLAQMHHEIELACSSSRRVFTTEGKLLGTGAKSVQPGDEVWVLAGAKVPLILRRSGSGKAGRHRLIGEAYVHGLMHGNPSRLGLNLAGILLE